MISSTSIPAALLSALLIRAGASPVKRQTYAAAIEKDFPDPSVIQAGDGQYYAYGTAGNGVQIQVARSSDGIDWEYQEGVDALKPGSIAWAPEDPSVWAPDVTPGPNANEAGGKHCIGFATATDPMGPFEPNSDAPWVCDTEFGDIDPDQFLDEDGSRWVTWKVDGNSAGSDSTPIMLQQVEEDGYTKIGDAIEILDRDEADGPLVEAPSLVKNEGIYYLTFSSNMYDTDKYDTSFATATSVTGPYTKAQAPDAPILTSDMQGLYGPGGADIFIVPGQNQVMLFHGWNADHSARYIYATSIDLVDGKITVYWG
ncbi:hypothetical protein LTR37_011879 [Vermiconidia calcicola]|uniref:Uncharacterized protein n=1 Tax=Vermiconidia calcicola TaxID=1690605 RepID=A0ACC3N1Q3_9PEZI|nr:hypothetical protein LTR37_011879 [Vermiconidia calcicola]